MDKRDDIYMARAASASTHPMRHTPNVAAGNTPPAVRIRSVPLIHTHWHGFSSFSASLPPHLDNQKEEGVQEEDHL
eukprot:1578616-Amphidinium_carterae.1